MRSAARGGEVAEVFLFLGAGGVERDPCAEAAARVLGVAGLRRGRVRIVRLRGRVVWLLVDELVGLRAVWVLLELVELRLLVRIRCWYWL